MYTYIKEYFVGNEAHHLQAVVHHLFPQLQERNIDSTTIASVTSIAKFFTHSAFVGLC